MGEDGVVSPIEQVAALVQRLAVLLEAGVAPPNAWLYLADAQGERRHGRIVRSIATAVARGAPVDQAVASASRVADAETQPAWQALAAAWGVATASGSPLGECLRELARALLDVADVHRSISVALAAPVATARLMTLLPVVAVGFGTLLGFDTLATLFTTPPGLFCLVSASVLLVAAGRWNRLLVRRARPGAAVPGIAVELMAVAMAGGASIPRARQLCDAALDRHALRRPGSAEQVDAVLALSARAGVPAAELLRSEGTQARRTAVAVNQRRAAALSVRLMLPLGVCVLPAFMLLGVAPLLIAVVRSTFASW